MFSLRTSNSVVRDLLLIRNMVGGAIIPSSRPAATSAGCRTLIEAAVRAFQSKSLDQFDIAGDNIAISSGPAITLSMVIHELCTNAVKYGALSARAGHVSISWAISQDDSKRFKLHWKERD